MKRTYRIFLLLLAASALLSLCGCKIGKIKETTYPTYTTAASTYRYETYASLDTETTYNPDYVTIVELNGTAADISGGGASVSEGFLTITSAGNYVLSGNFNGQIIIDANSLADVHLFFSNLTVTSDISAPLYVKSARKAVITLVTGTENRLYAPSTYNYVDEYDESEACIYSKSDITINGDGSLLVNDEYNIAIYAQNLIIVSGDITIYAKNCAIYGEETVTVSGGNITINAQYNAVIAYNNPGNIYIEGGTFDLTCGRIAFDAQYAIYLSGCSMLYDVGEFFNAQYDDIDENCATPK